MNNYWKIETIDVTKLIFIFAKMFSISGHRECRCFHMIYNNFGPKINIVTAIANSHFEETPKIKMHSQIKD